MSVNEAKTAILNNKTALGIEFGSTRIKAVLVDDKYNPIASGSYDWENQLDRIETVVKKFNKPFFFAETGCMSVEGSPAVPNNWEVEGDIDLDGQAEWFEDMLTACRKRDWVEGVCIWSWTADLYSVADVNRQKNYETYAKPAEKVIRKYYEAQ